MMLNMMVLASLRFWENKNWINSINPYDWFQWYFRYLDTAQAEDVQIMKDKLIDGKEL